MPSGREWCHRTIIHRQRIGGGLCQFYWEAITKEQHPCYLSCRISRWLDAKLNTFADATGRSRSDVLRWLILRARLQDLPKGWVETVQPSSSKPQR
jgi:hypothetical protein